MAVKFPTAQPVPRVPRSRRDDHYQKGHPLCHKAASIGIVTSIEDDTVTVLVSDEQLSGVIPLGKMPPIDAIVEIESRCDLLVILDWAPDEGTPYPFIDGHTGTGDDPVRDANIIPYLSDASDDTFMDFDTIGGGYGVLYLDGNPAVIPADSAPITSITLTFRARAAATAVTTFPTALQVWIRASPSEYLVFEGGPPPTPWGMVIPVSSSFTDITINVSNADAVAAIAGEGVDWSGAGTWTDLPSFVDKIRAAGGFEVSTQGIFTYADSQWDIAYAYMTFDTGGPALMSRSASGTPTERTVTVAADWVQTYTGAGVKSSEQGASQGVLDRDTNGDPVDGGTGHETSLVGFPVTLPDDADIRAVQLHVPWTDWWYANGIGALVLGWHDHPTAPDIRSARAPQLSTHDVAETTLDLPLDWAPAALKSGFAGISIGPGWNDGGLYAGHTDATPDQWQLSIRYWSREAP